MTVAALGLQPLMIGYAVLADGSSYNYDVCAAEVEWNGTWRSILVWALGDPLIGMNLISGHAIMIEAKPNGAVVIDRLP